MDGDPVNRLRKPSKKGRIGSKVYDFSLESLEGEMPLMYPGVDVKDQTPY